LSARLLAGLRRFALGLPETSESDAWGHPNFRVGKKTFAVYEHYHGRPCIAVNLPRADGTVVLSDPRFFVTPYVGKHGWVSLWVDGPVSLALVRDLVLRSYRELATQRQLAALDGPAPRSRRSPRAKSRRRKA
jgi:predicted DNA-binding protein (MmcQ/YjbR family)